ncbi:hypothetical protein YC2023_076443 [Brassica napus]
MGRHQLRYALLRVRRHRSTHLTVQCLEAPPKVNVTAVVAYRCYFPEHRRDAFIQIFLPQKMFTVGEEPYGERVSSYHKIKRTELIIDVLEPEEIEFLHN